MTPQAFRTWRQERGLSQNDLAQLLGWSRDQVARRELGAEIPADIGERLQMADQLLAARDTPTAPAKHTQRGWQHPRWLDIHGRPIDNPFARRQAQGAMTWQLDWVDKETGHEHYNLYQANRDGILCCTPLRMDAETMTARNDFAWEKERCDDMAVKLNELMAQPSLQPVTEE
jgi:DNA-binding XRE family transcriptional regulator